MQLERDWGDALAKRDLVALDRILGDDHSVITKDGSVLTKAQELAKHSEIGRRALRPRTDEGPYLR